MDYLLRLSIVILLIYNNIQGSNGNDLVQRRQTRDLSTIINILLGRECFCRCGVPNFNVYEYRALESADSSDAKDQVFKPDPADIEDAFFYTKFNDSLQATQEKYNETDDIDSFSIDEEKLLNGDELKENGMPWAVLILYRGQPIAGGAIISDRHIITAQSSLTGRIASDLKITAGLHDRCFAESTAWNVSVSAIIRHSSYAATDFRHDLAILTLSAKVVFNQYVSPICLPEKTYPDESQVGWISSWLSPVEGPTPQPNCYPKVIRLPTLTLDECLRANTIPGLWTYDKGCLGPLRSPTSICLGDVGSPVQVVNKRGRFELAGIIIPLNVCGTIFTTSYTRIDKHLGWIRTTIDEGCICKL